MTLVGFTFIFVLFLKDDIGHMTKNVSKKKLFLIVVGSPGMLNMLGG